MEYNNNLKVIEKYRPILYKKLMEVDVNNIEKKTEKIENELAKDGNLITTVKKNGKGVRLNSSYNPVSEAEIWVKQFNFGNMSNDMTMYGFGNGYFVKALLENEKRKGFIFIYEPSAEVFLNTLHNFNLESLLKNGEVVIGINGINEHDFQNALRVLYKSEMLSNMIMAKHPGYKDLFIEEFDYFKNEVQMSAHLARVRYNTLMVLAESELRNTMVNIPRLRGSISITQLKEIWNKDIPAIVVAAGPSLEDSVEALRKAKGKAIIVAVDRALQFLLDRGIKPDFVTNIDSKKSVKHFTTEDSVDIPMFCLTTSQPLIMDKNKGRRIICTCTGYLYPYYMEALQDYPAVEISGSVATVSIAALGYLGAKKICLVGQDLSYRGDKSHAGEDLVESSQAKLELIDGVNGEKVKSRYDWLSFKDWIENFIIRNPDITVIDTKKSGALIKGSTLMSLEEAIKDTDGHLDKFMAMVNQVPPAFNEEQFNKIKDKLVKHKNEIAQMKKKAKEGIGYCSDLINLVKQGKAQSKSIDSKVEKVRHITKYLSGSDFYAALDELVIAYMEKDYVKVFKNKEDEQEKLINVYDSSRGFFEAVIKVLKFVEPYMEEAIQKLEE